MPRNIGNQKGVKGYVPDCLKKNQEQQKKVDVKTIKENIIKEKTTKSVVVFKKRNANSLEAIAKKQFTSTNLIDPLEILNQVPPVDSSQQLLPSEAVISDITQIIRGGQNEPVSMRIGQEYLADCGLTPRWEFKCAPWRSISNCFANKSQGAWVPLPVSYLYDYNNCAFLKKYGGKQFDNNYDDEEFQ